MARVPRAPWLFFIPKKRRKKSDPCGPDFFEAYFRFFAVFFFAVVFFAAFFFAAMFFYFYISRLNERP